MKKIDILSESVLTRIVNKVIKENKEEEFINKVNKFIVLPYFYNLKATGVPEHLWEEILSKKFDQKVTFSEEKTEEYDPDGVVMHGWHMSVKDSNGNEIYVEYRHGEWSKYKYDSKGNEIYHEDSKGTQVKKEYHSNGKLKNQEWYTGKGRYEKQGWDSNGNRTYYDNSNGSWEKKEYDSRGNVIYHEDSSRQWEKWEYDSNDNEIYYENSDGKWNKSEYDSNGNEIYYEKQGGEWEKKEYDSRGNEIYQENSNGQWEKKEYHSNGELKYHEVHNKEGWTKFEYDSNSNEIYYQEDGGIFEKKEYDSRGNVIYQENPYGKWKMENGKWVKLTYSSSSSPKSISAISPPISTSGPSSFWKDKEGLAKSLSDKTGNSFYKDFIQEYPSFKSLEDVLIDRMIELWDFPPREEDGTLNWSEGIGWGDDDLEDMLIEDFPNYPGFDSWSPFYSQLLKTDWDNLG